MIGSEIFFTKFSKILLATSGVYSNAEPIPKPVDVLAGQPILTSIPETSFWTNWANATARSGDEVPIWNISLSFSVEHVRNFTFLSTSST